MSHGRSGAQAGATLIEILVTIVIVAFGLLGLAGLQMKMQMSETEAYQRSQALMLVNDMASRIANNRLNTASYITGTSTPLGTSYDCKNMASTTQADVDLKEWCSALTGAGEFTCVTSTCDAYATSTTSAARQGAMIGARGCIVTAADGDIVVSVVWQGLTPVSAPPSAVDCGANLFDGAGTTCTSDLCRRFITTVVRVGTLV